MASVVGQISRWPMGKIIQYPSNVNRNKEILKREGILKVVDERKGEVIAIEEGMEHFAAEMICVFCGKRSMDVFPAMVQFRDLECGECHKIGGMICTGQPIKEEDE